MSADRYSKEWSCRAESLCGARGPEPGLQPQLEVQQNTGTPTTGSRTRRFLFNSFGSKKHIYTIKHTKRKQSSISPLEPTDQIQVWVLVLTVSKGRPVLGLHG